MAENNIPAVKKIFNLRKCWLVQGWSIELIPGLGTEVSYEDGFLIARKVMFFSASHPNIMRMEYPDKVFFNLKSAMEKLEREKEDYISFLKKQKSDAEKKLAELTTTK